MANFKLPQNGKDIHTFYLPKDKTYTLVQWGGDPDGNRLQLELAPNDGQIWLWVSPNKMAEASTAFTLTNKVDKKNSVLHGFIPGTRTRYTEPLNLKAGALQMHPGMAADLIYSLAANGKEPQVHMYTRIFEDPEPLLQQNTEEGKYNCGDVCAGYAKTIFPGGVNLPFFAYYKKPTSDKKADLRFDPGQMQAAIGRIKGLVSRGIAVRVWVIIGDGFGPVISDHDHVHFVTIFAHGMGQFLFVDPWGSGSHFRYDGGINDVDQHEYIGQFTWNEADLSKGVRSSSSTIGVNPGYTLIAGP